MRCKQAGVFEDVEPLLIPMRGRMLHAPDGALTFAPYGQRPHEVIYSVSRPGLTRVLLDHAQRDYGVEPRFLQAARSLDFERDELVMLDEVSGDTYTRRARAADRRGRRGFDRAPRDDRRSSASASPRTCSSTATRN